MSVLEKEFKPGDLITSDDYNAIIEELKKLIEIAKPIIEIKPAFRADIKVYKPHVKVLAKLTIPTYLYKVVKPPIFTRIVSIPTYLKKAIKPEVSIRAIISIPTYLKKAAKPEVSNPSPLSISTTLTVTKA